MIIPELLYNLFGLVAMSVISGFIDARYSRDSMKGVMFQGIIFGAIAVAGMLTPYQYAEGIFFDGRSITLSLCTLFFGPVSGIVASLIAISCRIHLAGSGLLMGVLVITTSYLVGLIFYYLKISSRIRLHVGWLYFFGMTVHLVMFVLMFTLPMSVRSDSMKLLAFTILGVYPLVTILAGKILIDQENRKLSLQNIQEEQQRLKSTIYSINEAVITTDNEGRVQRMNPHAEILTGWNEQDARGESLLKIFTIKNNSLNGSNKNLIEQLLGDQHSEGISDHSILVNKDGRSIPVIKNVAPIRNDRGKMIGAVLIFRDHSNEVARLKEIMDSSALFRSAFHSSPVPMALMNAESGVFLDINEIFLKESGFDREEIIGTNPVPQMLEMNPETFPTVLNTLNNEGKITSYPLSINDKHGKNHCCLLSANRIHITGQDLYLITIIDITGQKEALESLSESEQRFRDIFDKHAAVKLLIDPETKRILDANQAAVDFYGYERELLLQKKMSEINTLPENELDNAIESIFSEQRVRFEFRHKVADGSIRDVEVFASSILLNGKTVIHSVIHDISERKTIQQALIQSERNYDLFINSSEDLIFIKNDQKSFIMVNQAMARSFNKSPEDLIGMCNQDVFESKTAMLEDESDSRIMTALSKERGETNIEGKIYEYTKFPIQISSGKTGIGGIYRDITKQKEDNKVKEIQFAVANAMVKSKSLKELMSSVKDCLANVMDTSNFLLALCDKSGQNLYAPFEVDENNDIPPVWPVENSLTGLVVKSRKSFLLNKEDTERIATEHNIIIRGTRSECWMGVPLLHGNSPLGVMVIQSYSDPGAYNDQSLRLLESIAIQISSYITYEASQEETRKLTRAVIHSPVSIAITDVHGNLEYVNPKFTETTGYSFNEAIGKNPRVLKSGKTDPRIYEDLWETILNGKEWKGEFINRRKNGEEYWEKAIISPIVNSAGKITHFLAVKEDITEIKKLHDELVTAKNLAEESDKLKTAFLQNMSHEIRTPLNGMLGFAYLLTHDNLHPGKIKEYASTIEKSGQRLLEMLNNLIDISKIESGTLEVNRTEFQLHKLIHDTIKPFEIRAGEKGIRLISPRDYNRHDLTIVSDSLKIHQILNNLLDNAIKFTQQGTIEVGYVISGHEIIFSVSDTGIGIPITKQSRIFERFYQADMSISRGFEGSGLGLAISCGLVELLKGKIWLESIENKGTTIFFSIPCQLESPVSRTSTEEESSAIKYKKILVAEDDDFSFTFLEAILEETRAKILRATTGEQAVKYCTDEKDIDLVLMDIKMPVMNGIQATRQIKQLRPGLPVIAQTAYAFASEMEAALDAGCDDYITKPLSVEKLNEILNRN